MSKAERITDVETVHGEGPCWDARSNRLLWVDMFAGSFLSTDVESGTSDRIEVAGPVAACLRPVRDGSAVVVAGERDIQLIDGDRSETLFELPLAQGVRLNDGGCDPQGRFYVGSLHYDLTPGAGQVWRLGGGDDPAIVFSGTTISNGIGWSPDGTLVYFVDSPTRRIDVFDFDPIDGCLGSVRSFAEISEGDGEPDGLCVDADGGVWVALWGGGAVRRYDPDGAISMELTLDCPPVTACAFGGKDMTTLFVTTSGYDGRYPEEPAGSLFAFDPGVRGLPVDGFALDSWMGSTDEPA